jgi:protein SCO1/2
MIALCFAACQGPSRPKQAVTDTVALPFYNDGTFTAEWITPANPEYATIHRIDTFALLNQLGHVFTQDSLKGRIYTANFFFTSCPSICPRMMDNLAKVQAAFANDDAVRLVSFSVTPWRDSVSVLRDYAERKEIIPGKWQLLTGTKERIYTLARQSYFAEKTLGQQKSSEEFLHTETVLLIDGQARIRGIYNATQAADMLRIIDDIRVLKEKL